MNDIFIVGSKGIPANYGGFKTFVDELVSRQKSTDIKYHLACLSDNNNEFEYKGAHCFNVSVPNIRPAKAVFYDLAALNYCEKYIKSHNIQNALVYVLACRIRPSFNHYVKKLHKIGVNSLCQS